MKRAILYMTLSIGLYTAASAQNMPNIVRAMPDSILPLLTKNDRLDFIDYLESSMKAEVTNKLGGKSEMTTVSEDYAHIKLTTSSEIALKLLPYKEDSIICMVHTYTANASDSKISFYTKDWQKLASKDFITMPKAKEFFTPVDSLSKNERDNLLNKLDMSMVKAEFKENSSTLVLTLTSPQCLSEENRKAVTPYIKNTIEKRWTGSRFE